MSQLQALVLARSVGFMFRAPGFGHPSVPPVLRAALAYVVALAVANGCTARARFDTPVFVCALAVEVVLGAAIGMAASMLYDGAYSGGRAVDDFVGIRASVPSAGIVAGAGFGRLWSLAFAAGFFILGGHRIAIGAFAATFQSLPPGFALRAANLVAFSVTLPATLMRAALFVGGPALALGLVVQVALASVARVVPRFSTFTLSFPLVLVAALVTTGVTLPLVLPIAERPWFDLSTLRGR